MKLKYLKGNLPTSNSAGIYKLLVATLCICTVTACTNSTAAENGQQRKDSLVGTTQEDQVNVQVKSLESEVFAAKVILVGEVMSKQKALVSSETIGTVQQISADRGKAVEKGDTIIVIDSRRFMAAFEATQAAEENARLDFDMAKRLYENGQGVSENDFRKAANGLKMAESSTANSLIDLENCFITAPFSGVIAERYVEKGELVSPGTPVIQLIDIENMKIRCGVPENQISQIKKSAVVDLDIIEADISASGKITWIGEVLDSKSRSLPIEISLNSANGMKAGMVCQVTIEHSDAKETLVIPITITQRAPDHVFVFIAIDGKAEKRRVTLGERNGELVNVLSGLDAGDKLIVAGFRDIVNGQSIRIVNGNS
jgi:membrane fusion protein, multidrug efflux system